MGSRVRKRVASCLLLLGPLMVQKCLPELLPPTTLEEGNGKIFSAGRKEGSLANTGKKETFLKSPWWTVVMIRHCVGSAFIGGSCCVQNLTKVLVGDRSQEKGNKRECLSWGKPLFPSVPSSSSACPSRVRFRMDWQALPPFFFPPHTLLR